MPLWLTVRDVEGCVQVFEQFVQKRCIKYYDNIRIVLVQNA